MNSANVFLFAIAFYAGVTPHLNTKAGLAEKAYLILIFLLAAVVTWQVNSNWIGLSLGFLIVYARWILMIGLGLLLGYGISLLAVPSVENKAVPQKEKGPGVV